MFQHVKKAKYGSFKMIPCQQFTGLVQAIKMEGQKTVTANWYTTKCLPEILQKVNGRGLMIHYDNASFHIAGLSVAFLQQKQIKVTEHPSYSTDLAKHDF
ncbi:UNVERIFIED_CONTAM: hypothetical protein NCL1_36097 [Trichonephila clavipes]